MFGVGDALARSGAARSGVARARARLARPGPELSPEPGESRAGLQVGQKLRTVLSCFSLVPLVGDSLRYLSFIIGQMCYMRRNLDDMKRPPPPSPAPPPSPPASPTRLNKPQHQYRVISLRAGCFGGPIFNNVSYSYYKSHNRFGIQEW